MNGRDARVTQLLEDAVAPLDPRPPNYGDVMLHAVHRRQQHRRVVVGGAALALVAVVAAGMLLTRGADDDRVRTVVPATSPTSSPAVIRPAADGDIDGDGRIDQVRLSGDVPRVTITATMTSLGTQQVEVPATYAPKVVGVVDADSDGFAEVFVQVDEGASTRVWSILRLVDGNLMSVTKDGEPLALVLGGGVNHDAGLKCVDVTPEAGQELVLASYAQGAGDTYDSETTVNRFDGPRLVQLSRSVAVYTRAEIDSRLDDYALACGSLRLE